MLYYDFQNYEGFKEIFGIVEHGNGVKSRRNKILLSLYKDRHFLKEHIRFKENKSMCKMWSGLLDRCNKIEAQNDEHLRKNFARAKKIRNYAYDAMERSDKAYTLLVGDIATLRRTLFNMMENSRYFKMGCLYRLNLNGRGFFSDSFETDDMNGLCEDGTINAIRYRNIEKDHVFKMKAGRMFNHLMSCNKVLSVVPEQIQRWLSEEFVASWIDYATENLQDNRMELHVDDNFDAIYDPDYCEGYDEDSDSFGSCMVGDGQWKFYRDAVDAKAAYLINEDGMITARCIIFTDVTDQDGRKWRLAERQYSAHCDPSLQRQLVSALVRGGHIDGYKRVGASCHDPEAFVSNEGESLSDRRFEIRCRLHDGDTMSYQDSFKWYDEEDGIAYNYEPDFRYADLAETRRCFTSILENDSHENERWSEYNQEWIDEDRAVYVETRDDTFYDDQTVHAYVRHSNGCYYEEDCFEDDCIEIDGDWYYAGKDADHPEHYGLCECPQCGSWFVPGHSDNCEYSDLTNEDYCCIECLEVAENEWHRDNGDAWSGWDDEWYDADEVITAREYNGFFKEFYDTTISVESFNDLVEEGKATGYGGVFYIDKVLYDGEPLHLHLDRKAA